MPSTARRISRGTRAPNRELARREAGAFPAARQTRNGRVRTRPGQPPRLSEAAAGRAHCAPRLGLRKYMNIPKQSLAWKALAVTTTRSVTQLIWVICFRCDDQTLFVNGDAEVCHIEDRLLAQY